MLFRSVLLTDLHNHAMPLINYELGDRVILAEGNKCKCGRNLKIIEQIEGRQGDNIQKSDDGESRPAMFHQGFGVMDCKHRLKTAG